MNSMYRKCNPPVLKASDLEIEPAFGIALVLSGGCITGSPDTIMIEGVSLDFHEIARIKFTIEENLVLFRL